MSVCKQTPRKNIQLFNRPSENAAQPTCLCFKNYGCDRKDAIFVPSCFFFAVARTSDRRLIVTKAQIENFHWVN